MHQYFVRISRKHLIFSEVINLTFTLATDQEKCQYGDSKCIIRVANNVISKASQGEFLT